MIGVLTEGFEGVEVGGTGFVRVGGGRELVAVGVGVLWYLQELTSITNF
jgi:hypothetical protein